MCWAFTQAKRTADELAALPGGPFYGIWRVGETMRDGVVVPGGVTDGSEWRDVVISDGVVVVSMSDTASAYRAMIDASADTIDLRPRPPFPSMTSGVPLRFRFSQPDRDHLEFRRIGGEGTLAIRVRHVDMSTYSLIDHRHEWRWGRRRSCTGRHGGHRVPETVRAPAQTDAFCDPVAVSTRQGASR